MSRLSPLDEVMTVTEVAAQYNVSVAAVRAACKRGDVSARKSGATWLIYRPSADKRWGWGAKLHDAYIEALDLIFGRGIQDTIIVRDENGTLGAMPAANKDYYDSEWITETVSYQNVIGYFADEPRESDFDAVAWMMVNA